MSLSSACPLCAGRRHVPLASVDRDRNPLRNVLCQGCGLVFVDPQPTREALDAWYTQNYRLDYKGVLEPKPHHVLRAGRVAIDRLARIRPLLLGAPRVLDVGSGGGEMLYMLTHLAGTRAEGLEPNLGYARHARERLGLPVHVGTIEQLGQMSDTFDLVTIHHVLEHLPHPREAMALLSARLRPGGHLVVEVPNVEATCQAPAHTFHRAHLTTWGIPTLERLGIECGLTPVAAATSPDGGNIDVVFVRDGARPLPADLAPARTAGYADHVAQVFARHTPLRHYASPAVPRRLFSRLARSVDERIACRRASDPRALLDALVAAARGTVAFRGLASSAV